MEVVASYCYMPIGWAFFPYITKILATALICQYEQREYGIIRPEENGLFEDLDFESDSLKPGRCRNCPSLLAPVFSVVSKPSDALLIDWLS